MTDGGRRREVGEEEGGEGGAEGFCCEALKSAIVLKELDCTVHTRARSSLVQ